jgi:hypothetical protein
MLMFIISLSRCSPTVFDPSCWQRLSRLAADGLLTCDADGTPSRWQPAGQKLQAAVLRLVEERAAPPPADPTAADAAPAATPAADALETYMGLLEDTLRSYSTTEAQDRAALGLAGGGDAGGDEAMPPRTRLALQFRLAQKMMLTNCMSAAVDAGASGMADAAKKLLAGPRAGLGDDTFDFSLTELKPLKRT